MVSFEENMKQILTIFQFQEEEKLKLIKDSMRKAVVYEMSFLRSYQYELELTPMAIDAFSPEIEIKKFIDDSYSGAKFKNFEIEVSPNRQNCYSKITEKRKNEIMENIIQKS